MKLWGKREPFYSSLSFTLDFQEVKKINVLLISLTLRTGQETKKRVATCESARSPQSARSAEADPSRAGVHKCRNMPPKNR